MDPYAAVLIALLVALWVIDRRRTDDRHHTTLLALAEQQADERRELAARIQRPDLLPLRPTSPRDPDDRPARDQAALSRIGRVQPLRDGPPPDRADVS